MKCPYCGKQVKLKESLLAGKLIPWHKPKRGAKLNFYGAMFKEFCGMSGTTLPSKQNPHAL